MTAFTQRYTQSWMVSLCFTNLLYTVSSSESSQPRAYTGTPCDVDGDDLDPGTLPPPPHDHSDDYYSPFSSQAEFELAELLYVEEEMSAGKINKLLKILSSLYSTHPPFTGHQELYALIDAIKQGDVPWNSFSVAYCGARPNVGTPIPPWMEATHEVWFRDPLQVLENQIANPEFRDMIDFSPKRVYHNHKCQYSDL